MVSMEVITACAGKGEILPVCSTEGGLHTDLALFLRSEVLPEGTESPAMVGGKRPDIVDRCGESDGLVTVGEEPDSITIRLKQGFRLVLFTTSLEFARLRLPSRLYASGTKEKGQNRRSPNSTSLVFFEDSPKTLAGIQLIRFGGIDSVSSGRNDRQVNVDHESPPSCEQEGNHSAFSSKDDASTSSSDRSISNDDALVPPLVLAGMGLIRQPGFEMSTTVNARLKEEIVEDFSSAVDGFRVEELMAAVITAQREALTYADQLSATHEAVVALLAARPRSFDPAMKVNNPKTAILPGGESKSGVTDDVEGDQNRVLNNLIETVFAYKSTLEKGLETVLKCNRESQATRAKAARTAGEVAQRLASFTLRLLARTGDMLHAWGLDPVVYSPVFPGVRALVHGVVRRAAHSMGSEKGGECAMQRSVLGSLSHSLESRLPNDSTWIVPLAAMATNGDNDFPARGWWDACMLLFADRHEIKPTTSAQLTLARLFEIVAAGALGTCIRGSKGTRKGMETDSTDGVADYVEATQTTNEAVAEGLAQVRAIIGLWRKHSEVVEAPVANDQFSDASGSNSDGDESALRNRTTISPQHWDLGFDTSGWAQDQGAATAAALAQTQCIPTTRDLWPAHSINVAADGGNGGDDGAETNCFCERLSLLWSIAKIDRSRMNSIQAASARPFCRDDVLRRLVLLETTMNGVFARLPAHVMSTPSGWSEWIAKMRCSLSSAQKESLKDGGRGSRDRLRFILSHPPPACGSAKKHARGETVTGSSSSPSSTDESKNSDSDSSSSSDSRGGESGNTIAAERSSSVSLTASHVSANSVADSGSSSTADLGPDGPGEPTPGAGTGGHARIRRDSRERMKLKLRYVDGIETVVGVESAEDAPPVANKAFTARAGTLFGVSLRPRIANIGIDTAPESLSTTAVPAIEISRVLEGEAKSKTGNSSVARSSDKDADSDEDAKYITFVAESFRPQRDNSNWHREAKSTPPPPRDANKRAGAALVLNGKAAVSAGDDELHAAGQAANKLAEPGAEQSTTAAPSSPKAVVPLVDEKKPPKKKKHKDKKRGPRTHSERVGINNSQRLSRGAKGSVTSTEDVPLFDAKAARCDHISTS